MQPPKLKSIIRNVRTQPRGFQFRSRHAPASHPEWEARKARVEAEVLGTGVATGEGQPAQPSPQAIRFRRGRTSTPAPGSRAERRRAVQRGARLYALRVTMWILALGYLVYRGWKWAEEKDWDTLLKGLRDAG